MFPIKVNLTPGHTILRSGGCNLAPDEEDFTELIFKVLEDTGIVKEPIISSGGPDFVFHK
eukprot:snap_masked-scaffold_1-processed-gene-14.34-mRNA-1 protein AED:1.00 eAED:1.00 QI:0/-1/0/0/-1/1/1/0/59